MATDQELKIRVRRLLDGSRDAANIERVVMGLRERSFGRRAFRDLGDFAAHSAERDMGFAWERSRDVWSALRFHLNIAMALRATKDDLVAALEANARLELPAEPKKVLHVGQKAARRELAGVISKITGFDQKTATVITNTPLSHRETKVLNHYGGSFKAHPIYTQNDIVQQFAEVLTKNNLMSSSETIKADVSDFIAVYTVWKIHFTEVIFDDVSPIVLAANISSDGSRYVIISSHKGSQERFQSGTYVNVPAFTTTCSADQWCHPSLLEGPNGWLVPLELVDGLLTPMMDPNDPSVSLGAALAAADRPPGRRGSKGSP